MIKPLAKVSFNFGERPTNIATRGGRSQTFYNQRPAAQLNNSNPNTGRTFSGNLIVGPYYDTNMGTNFSINAFSDTANFLTPIDADHNAPNKQPRSQGHLS